MVREWNGICGYSLTLVVNGMVRGDSVTLIREWNGLLRICVWSVNGMVRGEKKNENTTKNYLILDRHSRHFIIFGDRIWC